MPSTAGRPCIRPGCTGLTVNGSSVCGPHKNAEAALREQKTAIDPWDFSNPASDCRVGP